MTNKNLPNKKLLILLGALLFFLLILILVSVKQKETQNQMMAPETTEESEKTGEETDSSRLLPAPMTAPKLSLSTIDSQPDQPVVPERVTIYSFKSNYSPEYVYALGNKLGLTENKTEGNFVLVYNLDNENNRAYLQFDLTNGTYNFRSYGNKLAMGAAGQPATDVARNFLTDLGVIDDTVTCPITYQRKEVTDITFVECHRDWEKTGLPILSFTGLINLPNNQSLSDIRVGVVDEDFVDDPSVINTSTGQDGKKRPDEFNTATVAVANNGEILSITSNIRQVQSVSEVLAGNLLNANDALDSLKAGNSDLTFIAPQNPVGVNWDQVFPSDQAVGSNSNITDIMLTYLEQPDSAKELKPMYLVRGTTQLQSGYPARFLNAVSAMRQTVSEIYQADGFPEGVVAAATAGPFEDPTLKLGTFNPEQRTGQGQGSQGSQSYPPGTQMYGYGNAATGCVPSESQLDPIIKFAGLGLLGRWTINAPSPQHRAGTAGTGGGFIWQQSGEWFLIPTNYQMLPSITEVVTAFDALNLPSKQGIRELSNLQNLWNKNRFCPLRVSGGSPTIHLYGTPGSKLTLKVGRDVVYSSTGYNNGWNVSIGANNLLKVNGQSAAYIYYEYEPVEFSVPSSGWVTTRKNLGALASEIGQKIQLNSSEVASLAFELNRAANNVDSDNLYVAPIPQAEVDQKIPLSVSDSSYQIARYHFYVGIADKNLNVSIPSLTPVKRSPNLIVELGAVGNN